MIYQVSYELKTQDKDYGPLFNYLEKKGRGGIHVLRDTWWIDVVGENLNEVFQQIHSLLGDEDVFYCSQIDVKNINGWMSSSVWDWFKEHKNHVI